MKRFTFALGLGSLILLLAFLRFSAPGHEPEGFARVLAAVPSRTPILDNSGRAEPQFSLSPAPSSTALPAQLPPCPGSGASYTSTVGSEFTFTFTVDPYYYDTITSFSFWGTFAPAFLQMISIIPGNIPNITNFAPAFDNIQGTFSALGYLVPPTAGSSSNNVLATVSFRALAQTAGTQIVVPNYTVVYATTGSTSCQGTITIIIQPPSATAEGILRLAENSVCMDGVADYLEKCDGTIGPRVTSSTFNIDQYGGQPVLITGTWVSGIEFGCDYIDATSIQIVPNLCIPATPTSTPTPIRTSTPTRTPTPTSTSRPAETVCGQVVWATWCTGPYMSPVFIPCGSTTPHKWEPPSFTPGAYYRVYDATFQTMDPWCTREFGDVTSRLASWSRYEQITSCGVCAVTATPTGTTVPTRTPTRTPTLSPTPTRTSPPTAYTVSGWVTDGSNNPISGVTISDGTGHTTTTDSNGNYTLGGLAAGMYTLTPSKSGYTFSPTSRTVIVPPSKTSQDFVSRRLPQTCTVPFFWQREGWPQHGVGWWEHPLRTNGACSPQCGTIGACGCTLTSAAMVFSYYGASLNPPALSDCMGTSACPFNWGTAASYTNRKATWVGQYGFSWSRLDQELNQNHRPVILGMHKRGNPNDTHWVVVVSGQGNDPANYYINDPWFVGGANMKLSARTRSYDLDWISVYSGQPSCTGMFLATPGPSTISQSPELESTSIVTGTALIYSITEVTMTVQLIAQSSVGNVAEMLVWTDTLPNTTWQPFESLVSLPVSDNIYARFRDEFGNVSEVYMDTVYPIYTPRNPPIELYLPVLLKNYAYGGGGCLVESPHPYPDNYDNTWTLINPDTNAASTRIYFSRLETESGYDYVYVQDANNNQINRFTGNYSSGVWSDPVPGRTVKVQLTSDGSVTAWGFCVDRIETISTGGTNTPTPTATATRTPTATPTATTTLPTLLLLRFEGSFNGEDGEQGVANGPTFVAGHTGLGVLIDDSDTLYYQPEGNINPQRGNIELWLKPLWAGNDNQNHVLLDLGNGWYNRICITKDAANNFRFLVWSPDTEYGVSHNVSDWAPQEWHHIRVTWQGDTIALYLDGVLCETRSSVVMPSALVGRMYIGSSLGESQQAQAVIDDFVVMGTMTPTPTATRTPTVTQTQTPTRTPTATPTVTSEGVSVTSVWTADGDGNAKSTFNPGDSIRYYGNVYNSTGGTVTAYFQWSVNGSCGSITSWSGNLSTSSGNVWWYLPVNIPSNACAGTYTYQLSVTYGGQTSSQSTIFTVIGGIPTATPTPTPTQTGYNVWTQCSQGIGAVEVRSLAISPGYASDRTLFAGTWGNGVYKSADGGDSWSTVNSGIPPLIYYLDVYALALSPGYASDRTLFVGSPCGVLKSTDGGTSWSTADTGLLSPDVPCPDILTLALSPGYAADLTLFAGTLEKGVFKSTNGGASWNAVPWNTGLNSSHIEALTLSPSYTSDRTLFAGTDRGVFKSTDGGYSWNTTSLTSLNVHSLALSPGYASDRTLFAGTDGGGVLKSSDGGFSWSTMNTGLTNLNVYTLALSPSYVTDRTLFAGTGGSGVFKSTDSGTSWSAMNEGLGDLGILSLNLTPTSPRTLFAGTYGSSVWQYTFAQ